MGRAVLDSEPESGVPGGEHDTGEDTTDFKDNGKMESGEAGRTPGQAQPRQPPGQGVNSGTAPGAGVPRRSGPSPLPPDARPQLAFAGLASLG